MAEGVRRIFVEKKAGYAVEAESLLKEFRDFLGVKGLEEVRVIHRYDIEGIGADVYEKARNTVFAETPVDDFYEEDFIIPDKYQLLAIESLPGQYDQRADMAALCLQLINQGQKPELRYAKLILLAGDISRPEYLKIKEYCINPLESREANLDKPLSLKLEEGYPEEVGSIDNFTGMTFSELESLHNDLGLAMSIEDLRFVQTYFQGEKRNPTLTEIRVLDTYWSDHCRHTTFLTELVDIEIRDGFYSPVFKEVYQRYLESREAVYSDRKKGSSENGRVGDTGKDTGVSSPRIPGITLMDLATIGMKELKRKGLLADLDESEEINACSIKIKVEIDGKEENWLLMFKNETHNHPTEMEPFGGAATCLGGAIRDPLSGRSYVYQAMRVSGSWDPRTPFEETMEGKLPQRKISTGAALGYSSYGNQIGLAAGQVAEVYHENFLAKRMECGAVIAAAPVENVVRQSPVAGDLIILLGGRTGRDGCGGATGSSRKHDEKSLASSGAEVQKGNPLIERNIQRLFRKPEVSKMIKKCNDFGAGGVSVAIGELADSLEIDLDAVPVKYPGLDGTELAISESQERMAVVIDQDNLEAFLAAAREENLEATPVAVVTDTGRLQMKWRGQLIVDLARDFLNSNGVTQEASVTLVSPEEGDNYLQKVPYNIEDLKRAWLENLSSLNVCSQRGLAELFDSTVGANTVFLPYGGKQQLTPVDGMVAKIPVLEGEANTASIMTYAYDPELFMWSPFHGGVYSLVHAVAKIVALGGDYKKTRLSLQEYFGSPGLDRIKWGKPFTALLGAYLVQTELAIPSIGGKDSMSGTYKDLDVPPTVIAFAVNTVPAHQVISPEFKEAGSKVIWLRVKEDKYSLPDFTDLKEKYDQVYQLIREGKVLAASAVQYGGLAATISKMCFGNNLGFTFKENIFSGDIKEEELFLPEYGSIILELKDGVEPDSIAGAIVLGETSSEAVLKIGEVEIRLEEALESWIRPLDEVYPARAEKTLTGSSEQVLNIDYYSPEERKKAKGKLAKPTVFIPVFPGTGGEYELAHKFQEAGAKVEVFVFKNLNRRMLEESIDLMARKINEAQILALPGGASAGDEPEGAGKFIASLFQLPPLQEAVMSLLEERDGLILGIGNGFQALIKLGLLPYGEFRELGQDSPTISYNKIGRFVSTMVRTRVVSTLSPWLAKVETGSEFVLPFANKEGRFLASEGVLKELIEKGQIATQYVDPEGNPTYDLRYNPGGSILAIEGISSPDGRIFGKMAHSERIGDNVARNIPGEKDQKIFAAGVEYFM